MMHVSVFIEADILDGIDACVSVVATYNAPSIEIVTQCVAAGCYALLLSALSRNTESSMSSASS